MEENQGRFATDLSGWGGIWLFRGAFISGADPNAREDTMHHFNTRGIICCPIAAKPDSSGVFSAGFGTTHMRGSPGSTFGAWEITDPPPAFHGSYGFNTYLFSGFSERPTGMGLRRFADLDVFSLKGRANIPTLLDAASMWGTPRALERPSRRDTGGGGPGMGTFCINRHDGYVSGLFLDWSVRKVGLKELWTLQWCRDFDTHGRWTKAGGVQPEDWPEWMRKFRDY